MVPSTLELAVPDDLTEFDQWVLWRFVPRDGKPTKVPFRLNGKPASAIHADLSGFARRHQGGTKSRNAGREFAGEDRKRKMVGRSFAHQGCRPFARMPFPYVMQIIDDRDRTFECVDATLEILPKLNVGTALNRE